MVSEKCRTASPDKHFRQLPPPQARVGEGVAILHTAQALGGRRNCLCSPQRKRTRSGILLELQACEIPEFSTFGTKILHTGSSQHSTLDTGSVIELD